MLSLVFQKQNLCPVMTASRGVYLNMFVFLYGIKIYSYYFLPKNGHSNIFVLVFGPKNCICHTLDHIKRRWYWNMGREYAQHGLNQPMEGLSWWLFCHFWCNCVLVGCHTRRWCGHMGIYSISQSLNCTINCYIVSRCHNICQWVNYSWMNLLSKLWIWKILYIWQQKYR